MQMDADPIFPASAESVLARGPGDLHRDMPGSCLWSVLLAVWGVGASMPAAEPAASARSSDLTERSLDELMNIEVRSVARKQQTMSQSAAAIFVITQEDLRRSGATTIAEALRLAPGLDVARIDASKWAISSRGFNDYFANKLLVLQDGRSLYTPLFSGVYWDVQDTMMEDIDRIEVIRGPGASLWGANAVNGVINITTKSAKETQGTLVTGGGGNEETGFGGARYGGKFAENGFFRVYAKYMNHDDFRAPSGSDGSDEWNMVRGGFRADWEISPQNTLTLQGDIYGGDIDQAVTIPAITPPFGSLPLTRNLTGQGDVSGGNVSGKWNHSFSADSDLSVQLYYDRAERRGVVQRELRDTFDADSQYRFQLGNRQEIMVGAGYRFSEGQTSEGSAASGNLQFIPARRGDQLASAFVQDEITLIDKRLRLTLGSKFEHNDYTGFEVQPGGRLLWTPHEKHTVWASVARAVRTPSERDHDILAHARATPRPPPAPPAYLDLIGNPQFRSENLIAYELGYRLQPRDHLSFDLATFYNDYDDLRDFLITIPTVAPVNSMTGEAYGAELAANWRVIRDWRLSASYTWFSMQLHPGQAVSQAESDETGSPRHQFQVHSYLDLPLHLQLDAGVYYVDNIALRQVPSYVRLDLRLGWRPRENLEFSIAAQNVLDDRHVEFGSGNLFTATEVERSIYGKVTWRF